MPNHIDKASLPPLYFQIIKSDGARHNMSCIIYIIKTDDSKILHLATIFLQLVAKRQPEDFFSF